MRIGQFTPEEVQALKALFEEAKTSLPEPTGLRDAITQATIYSDLKMFTPHPGGLRNAIVHGVVRDDSCERYVSVIPLATPPASGVTVVKPLMPPPGGPGGGGVPTAPGDDDHRMIRINAGAIAINADASIPFESTASLIAPPAPPTAAGLWLDNAAFFIPRSIREPFLGDLREDLAEMAAKGYSRTAITRRALAQVLLWASLRILELIRRR